MTRLARLVPMAPALTLALPAAPGGSMAFG